MYQSTTIEKVGCQAQCRVCGARGSLAKTEFNANACQAGKLWEEFDAVIGVSDL